MSKLDGLVKFYSHSKGYGFIFSRDQEDVWFHITGVLGPNPPQTGDEVSFSLAQSKKGKKAIEVTITKPVADGKGGEPGIKKEGRQLNGFPCIRGDSLRGFRVQRHCGGWFRNNVTTDEFSSANSAKDALLYVAKNKGANAILNFHTHKRTFWSTGLFGGKFQVTLFWVEGEPVYLEPDD